MKILITTLNSKYIHSSLSIRYLKEYCNDIFPQIEYAEFTINQNPEYIAGEIYKKKPDVVAFSCYIWNIENTLEIAETLKLVSPSLKIVLGGPEVSFDGKRLMNNYQFVDFIVYGEGEETFRQLLIDIDLKKHQYRNIPGLIYRSEGKIIENGPRELICNLDSIPSPFNCGFQEFKDKIVYFESSRGCPFNCQFCLSSTINGVRFFSLDRVKTDLEMIIKAGVKQVKFVDRTFNTKKEYALEIMKHIIAMKPQNMNFHFEVTAHLLDEEVLDFLKNAPEGLFQFEIGVQSTNPSTLKEVDRTTDIVKLKEVVNRIKSYRNIHQHLDLIAGLPYEDYDSFKNSFNEIYELEPDMLQLGFLKLLKGSGLRIKKDHFGFKFLDKPPYEVIENNYISYEDMLKLKGIENLVEGYRNSGGFNYSLGYIIDLYFNSPFDFFQAFGDYWEKKDLNSRSHSKNGLYKIILEFYSYIEKKELTIFNEIVKFDYLLSQKNPTIPSFMKTYDSQNIKSQRHNFLKNEDYLEKYLSAYKNIPAKKIINHVHFEEFKINVTEFIKNKYRMTEDMKRTTIILFVYNEDRRVFDRCNTYNVTNDFIKNEVF